MMRYVGTLLFVAVLLCMASAVGQGSIPMIISPTSATLVVGQTQPFRAVDRSGRLLPKASWTVSGPGISRSEEGAELLFSSPAAGEFHITARAAGDSAEASVKVLSGNSLPIGSTKWSVPDYPGCKKLQIVPAPPSDSGIDVYESESCEDGTYLRAFTSDGIQVWRHKISGQPSASGARPAGERAHANDRNMPGAATRLDGPITSFCDRVIVGAKQAELRDLLASSHLQAVDEPSGGGSWLIEEQNSQCRLWFDDNSAVTRKRKVLVAQ